MTDTEPAVSDTTKDMSQSPSAGEHRVNAETAGELAATNDLLLLSLPIDSLHCIASFLSPSEWSSFGQTAKGAKRVCQEVFRRVMMHSFRCACEVVTAWKLGHHADARELASLYLNAGVPIYPYSQGHSYHTLVWRMRTDVKELLESQQNQDDETSNAESPVDRFYSERFTVRSLPGYVSTMTYLEEKCLFLLCQGGDPSGRVSWNSNGRRHSYRNVFSGAFSPDRMGASRGLAHSSSNPDLAHFRTAKTAVKVHRHLVDQHLLGRSSVDDEQGIMSAAPVCLSADFFHPHFTPARNSMSEQARPRHPSPESMQAAALPDEPAVEPVLHRSAGESDLDIQEGHPIADTNNNDAMEAAVQPVVAVAPIADADDVAFQPTAPHVLSDVELDVYSNGSASLLPDAPESENLDPLSEIKKDLRQRFDVYHKRLETLLSHNDGAGFEECILDFWDEFFPQTANVQYYDRHTVVPRISGLHKFLTRPCPKAFGIVQCEIERIKTKSKKKGVNMKGRFFPSYEYRLFIRDRSSNAASESAAAEPDRVRRDTVLMVAKNRGRKYAEESGVVPVSSASKKGVNNFYLYMPQQRDVDSHFNGVNDSEEPISNNPNGASHDAKLTAGDDSAPVLLGRLQSNFVGTEFQIYSPRLQKKPPRRSNTRSSHGGVPSEDEDELDYDSGAASDNASSSSRRRNLRSRLSLRRGSGDLPKRNDDESREKRGPWSSLRSSRTNRRAIASSTVDAPEPRPCQSVLCEEEDGAITYTANLLGSRPRIMDVCIPKVSPQGFAGVEWRRYLESREDDGSNGSSPGSLMMSHFKQLQHRLDNPDHALAQDNNNIDAASEGEYRPPDDFGLVALQNRPPWWNNELGAFVLNFGGRVSVASVKNFQLCDRADQEQIMLQFGRIQGRHSFTMDFQYPLTAVQAFAIAISSLQSKISFG